MSKQRFGIVLALALAGCGQTVSAPQPLGGKPIAVKPYGLQAISFKQRNVQDVLTARYDLEAGLIDGHVYQVTVIGSRFLTDGQPSDALTVGVIKDGFPVLSDSEFEPVIPGFQITSGATSSAIRTTVPSPPFNPSSPAVEVAVDFRPTDDPVTVTNNQLHQNEFGLLFSSINRFLVRPASISGTLKWTTDGVTTTLSLPATTLVPVPGSQQTVGSQTTALEADHFLNDFKAK